jgi:hypothetical protein
MMQGMILYISGERLLSELQKDFSAIYPYLSIEFFKGSNIWLPNYPSGKRISAEKKVKDAWFMTHSPGELYIDASMKVSELEQLFMSRFGLAVQVFRRSGNIWLETTMTDNWTLQQQNGHGQEITNGMAGNYYEDDKIY